MMVTSYLGEAVYGLINQIFEYNDVNNHKILVEEWNRWAQQADSSENRTRAVEELTCCLYQNRKELYLSDLGLRSLPARLPPSIEILQIGHNRLTDLPLLTTLPLKVIDASNNAFSTLPEWLPASLEELVVESNQLSILPPQLPASLTLLNVENNQLKKLPTQLPPALEHLRVGYNQLTSLSNTLPLTLQIISIYHNQLNMLPTLLPVNLRNLDVANNQLNELPPLPEGLQYLDVSHNRLATLPDPLPPRLEFLHADSNQLTRLPTALPFSLQLLCVNDNALRCLPEVLPPLLGIFEFNGNPLDGFWARIQDSDIPLSEFLTNLRNDVQLPLFYFTDNIQPWSQIRSEAQFDTFTSFLKKLQGGPNNQDSVVLRQRVGDWLDYLAKEENRVLRANTFLIAQEATTRCVDRASFYFNKMYLLMREDQLIKTDTPVVELFNTNLGLFRLQQLEKIASQKAETRRGVSSGFAEELEIYLAYECLLREELSLPIYSELQFSEIAGLTQDDLTRAKNEIEQQEKAGFIGYLINESASWQARLTQWDRLQVESVEEAYLDFIGSDDFNQQVNRQLMKDKIDIHDADAQRNMSKTLAEGLLYQQRYQLTKQFLAVHNALWLLDGFHLKYKPL